MNKCCMNCRKYERYYLRQPYFFSKADCGYCSEKKEITQSRETCGHWMHRTVWGVRKLRREICAKTLNDMADNLIQIRCILFDRREEEEEAAKDMEEAKNNGSLLDFYFLREEEKNKK